MKKIAIFVCLTGERCHCDRTNNQNTKLLRKVNGVELVLFCLENACFGMLHPTIDLLMMKEWVKAFSNLTGANLSLLVLNYVRYFFDKHSDLDSFIGNDRSHSCRVCSTWLYNRKRELLSGDTAALITVKAMQRSLECWDARNYIVAHLASPIVERWRKRSG